MAALTESPKAASSAGQRWLDRIERVGNKLPDPTVLFLIALLIVWATSVFLAPVQFKETDPRTIKRDATGNVIASAPIEVKNQLGGDALAVFLARMVKTFVEFPPLGVVLVAMLGVGVAEHTGFINATIRKLLQITPGKLLTPMLLLVAIVSHSTGDAGYVLVIPLGGVIFAAAGRHPLAGIAAAFAGVAGGFSANFLPSLLDPLLQGFTQAAAQIIDPNRQVNVLCNWYFTSASCFIILSLGWFITDRIIEPRLANVKTETASEPSALAQRMSSAEERGFWAGFIAMIIGLVLLVIAAVPTGSPLRSPSGSLTEHGAPLMDSIVPLILLLFLIPGIIYGYVAKTIKGHRDIIEGMTKTMSTMGYYLVMAFAAAQFTYAFRESNLGALIAIKGASFLKEIHLPAQATIVGVIIFSTLINLLIGSASAKWALLGPIFVPMLMQLGISPELTQAAYRIGDSSTNIVTPLLPYFPLIVVYCQRYLKSAGVGTVVSLMLPYSITFLVVWTVMLLVYWWFGLPLGLQASYTYP
jgi:aminobenzoyl-glutamate transport protein